MKVRQLVGLSIAQVAIVGFLLALSFPGTMTNDSARWLRDARAGVLSDYQPIGATLMWSLIDPIWPGPLGFVAVNLVLLVGALLLFFHLATRRVLIAVICTVAVLAYPTVLTILPVAWRDVTGLGLLLASLVLAQLVAADRGESTLARVLLWSALLVLCFVGSLFRENHAAGALSVVAMAAGFTLHRAGLRPGLSGVVGVVVAAAILMATSIAAFRTASALTMVKIYPGQAWIGYNIGLLSLETGQNLFPRDLYPDLTLQRIEELYAVSHNVNPRNVYRRVFWGVFGPNPVADIPVLDTASKQNRLAAAFAEIISRHPLAFARVRLRETLQWLDPSKNYSRGSYIRRDIPERHAEWIEVDFPTSRPFWSARLLGSLAQFNATILNRTPIPLMVLAVVLAAIAVVAGLPNAVLMLVVSSASVLHLAGVVAVAAVFEFRFGHQTQTLALVCIALFVVDLVGRLAQRRSPAPAPPSVAEAPRGGGHDD